VARAAVVLVDDAARMKRLVVVALAGCWSAPQVPATGSIPGLLWQTPAQPWRMTHAPTALAVDGDAAIVGGPQGWLAKVDLATGATVRERRVGGSTFYDLARMRDGRWVIVGNDLGVTHAYVVDRELATTEITLGAVPDRSPNHAGVAVMADGGVVIAGTGLPLAIYDPQTWKIRRILASEIGWNRPRISGATLGITLGSNAWKFDLATGEREELGPAATVQATAHRVALRVYDEGRWYAEVWEGGERLARLPDPVEAIALDGDRLITTAGAHLHVYAIPELATPAITIDLGAEAKHGILGLFVDGDRVLVSYGSLLRVVDLPAKRATPIGDPPWTSPEQLVVDDTGTVMAIARSQVWWLANGRVTGGAATDAKVGWAAPGDATRFVTRTDAAITLRTRTGQRGRWELADEVLHAWVGAADDVYLETLFTHARPSALVHLAKGGAIAPVVEYTAEGDVGAIGDRSAVIRGGGSLFVVDLQTGRRDPRAFAAPACAELASIAIERRGGSRLVAYDHTGLVVWNRTTGAATAVDVPSEIIGESVDFVGTRDELVLGTSEGLALVEPAARRIRTLALPDLAMLAISPDGARLAIAFGNGRIALVDVAALRAALPVKDLAGRAPPARCKAPDVFAVKPSPL